MLSAKDNARLAHVGSGTPMGELMRQYWMPALLSEELTEANGAPVRVRLLGEPLIAFRNTNGEVGILGEHCPHRGASLYFARNENCALQCVYHGWRFDKNGQCLETPNEPPESNLRARIRHISYPCVERNGVIWAYMGKKNVPPPLPDLEWNTVPKTHVHISMRYQECNWAQTLEGGIDSSHGSFLHALLQDDHYQGEEKRGWSYVLGDRHPRFDVADTDYGIAIGARRAAENDQYYWRVNQFLMPFYTMIPPYGPSPVLHGHAFVPMDDEHTLVWTITWHPIRALNEKDANPDSPHLQKLGGGLHVEGNGLLPKTSEAAGAWRPAANKHNDYLMSRGHEKSTRFMSVPGVATQDAAVQESMGPIYDRQKENLGLADAGIIRFRRRMLRAAEELEANGTIPLGVSKPEAYRIRAASLLLPRNIPSWFESARDWIWIKPGVHLDAA